MFRVYAMVTAIILVMGDEITELREQAEEAEHNPLLRQVSLTMALLAVLNAAVGLMSHRAHTEAILMQAQASDQWSYMQAKNIRMHTYSLFSDLLELAPPAGADDAKNAAKRQTKRESYAKQSEKYRDDVKEIEKKARELERERDSEEHRATRFDMGEVLLEVAMVLSSVTLLTRTRIYWLLGLAIGAGGAALAASGFLVH